MAETSNVTGAFIHKQSFFNFPSVKIAKYSTIGFMVIFIVKHLFFFQSCESTEIHKTENAKFLKPGH
jgi:hypothetical protein